MANLLRKYKSLYSSTANSFGTGEGETITPNSVSGLPTDTEITLTFDMHDSQGADITDEGRMERIIGTISGGNFVIASGGRGADGTTEQAHTSPVVEMIWNAEDLNDIVDWGLVGHTQTGAHASALALTSPVLTTPKVITQINDTNGNELAKVTATASAVNEITIANAATGTNPTISATGGDSTAALGLKGKSAFLAATGIYAIGTAGTTETVSWENGDRQSMTLDENITITFADAVAGQTLTLYMLQDGSGTNTITFADSIVWSDGAAPTWTVVANKMNIAVIFYSGSAYYGVGNKFNAT